MLTVREKYLAVGKPAEHKQWAESEAGEIACDYALLALIEELPQTKSAIGIVDVYSMLEGARAFRKILLEIHKPAPETKKAGLLGPNLKLPS